MALISDERGTLVLRKAWARTLRRIRKGCRQCRPSNVGLSPARAGPVLLQEVCDLRHGCRHRAARQNPPPATRWWATNFEYVTIWEMSGSSHRCIQFTALSHPMSLVGRWQNQAGVLLLKRLEPRLSSKGSVHEALPDSKASACHASVGPLPSQPCC